MAASLGQLLLHPELPGHLCPNLKSVLLLMPYGRLQRQFMMFSMDKKSTFNKLRIMHNTVLMLWSHWFRFLLTEVHRKWWRESWSQAWVGVSRATGPCF